MASDSNDNKRGANVASAPVEAAPAGPCWLLGAKYTFTSLINRYASCPSASLQRVPLADYCFGTCPKTFLPARCTAAQAASSDCNFCCRGGQASVVKAVDNATREVVAVKLVPRRRVSIESVTRWAALSSLCVDYCITVCLRVRCEWRISMPRPCHTASALLAHQRRAAAHCVCACLRQGVGQPCRSPEPSTYRRHAGGIPDARPPRCGDGLCRYAALPVCQTAGKLCDEADCLVLTLYIGMSTEFAKHTHTHTQS